MTFEEAVTATDPGTIVVCNIIDAVAAGVLSREIAAQFVKLWRQVFAALELSGSVTLPDEIVDAVPTITDPASLKSKYGIESDRDFRFIVRTAPASELLATVTLAGFLEKSLDAETRVELSSEGLKFPFRASATKAREAVARLKGLPAHKRRFRYSEAGLGDRTLWVTMADRLNAAVSADVDDAADLARDLLGLVDLKQDDVIVSVTVPAGPLASRRHARPTIFDGGNRRFRGVPVNPPEPLDASWGWTFDLRSLSGDTERNTGVPERICDGRPATGFAGEPGEFTALGVLELPRKDPVGVADDEFAELLRAGRRRADLMAALQALD